MLEQAGRPCPHTSARLRTACLLRRSEPRHLLFSERLSWKEEGERSGPALRALEHARSRHPFIYRSLPRSCPALSPLTHVEHRSPHGDLEKTSGNIRKPLAWGLTLAPAQHQQESPVWGAVKKDTLQFKQHDPGTARPHSSAALEPLSGATAHTGQRGPRPPASPGPAPLAPLRSCRARCGVFVFRRALS